MGTLWFADHRVLPAEHRVDAPYGGGKCRDAICAQPR